MFLGPGTVGEFGWTQHVPVDFATQPVAYAVKKPDSFRSPMSPITRKSIL